MLGFVADCWVVFEIEANGFVHLELYELCLWNAWKVFSDGARADRKPFH
jgi:hypothetical protein